jgi:hypothetical protein
LFTGSRHDIARIRLSGFGVRGLRLSDASMDSATNAAGSDAMPI